MIQKNHRYLFNFIKLDALASYKMVFISGPRQVGKSTLARALSLHTPRNFFSWDQTTFKKNWIKNPEIILQESDSKIPIVLDEIHKDKKWKQRLKGLYDLHGETYQFIITGSARLDYYRKGSDSLLARYLPYRLNPFSVAESETPPTPDEILTKSNIIFPWKDLMTLGGFPEPLLQGSENKAQRWSRLRLDRILLEDIRDFRNINDIESLRILTSLIPESVGSLLSINSLREDLDVAYATVRAWVQALESLYFGFYVRPYSGKIRRMVKSEAKFYLYDILALDSIPKRLENLTALLLLKACQFWTDTAQGEFSLHFLRNKDKKEVDFCIVRNKKPWMLVECKSGSKSPNSTLIRYAELLGTEKNFQLVDADSYRKEFKNEKVTIIDYESFFSGLV